MNPSIGALNLERVLRANGPESRDFRILGLSCDALGKIGLGIKLMHLVGSTTVSSKNARCGDPELPENKDYEQPQNPLGVIRGLGFRG